MKSYTLRPNTFTLNVNLTLSGTRKAADRRLLGLIGAALCTGSL
jgi:hypothetical protein